MTTEAQRNLPILKVGGKEATAVGNYFVANYPPFSFWTASAASAVEDVLGSSASPGVPLGLYVHIPFCRKRCDFCYFRVYTDKNARQIERYIDAVIVEVERYAARPYLRARHPSFIYFGGGTPSYLSVEQLTRLFTGLQRHLPWGDAREIAFECEPGTLQEKKIAALREMGVTRLSLGVENFDPDILELNNRAHRAKEIFRAYDFARSVGFPQINIDLIAGMVGETEDNWKRCIEETIRLAPDSVTIYQMELPFNTTISRRLRDGQTVESPVADWATKRRWVSEAFDRLGVAGYRVGSAYTAVRGDSVKFLYRDALWTGADMLGVGVSSFSHLRGVHFQNQHDFDPYIDMIEAGRSPIHRALVMNDEERLIREFILQMKLGSVNPQYFRQKFDVDPIDRFREPLDRHASDGMLEFDANRITLSREGLLQVDRLLPEFFLERHREARYA
jgi:oxygen-independent coproporphyrinogen-3 oxidase